MENHDIAICLPTPLDILGQTERINCIYTNITFCFPTRIDGLESRMEIIDNLEMGLGRLSQEFPWITGTVVKGNDGFIIKRTETDLSLVVRELRDDPTVPTWDQLRQANFPFRMLDEDIFAPCKTIVEPGADKPVLLTQVNFVSGGILLTFCAQHGSMDMTGQGQAIFLLAKACRGEDFTRDETATGNMLRTNRIPLVDEKMPYHTESLKARSEELFSQVELSGMPSEAKGSEPCDALVWSYFEFSAASLSSLKTLGSQCLVANVNFVSTDDILSAFVWQSISRARQPRLDNPRSTTTTLIRNVNVRRHFGLPLTYPGLTTTSTSHTHLVDDIVNKRSLSAVASELRAALDPDSLRQNAMVQATAIANSADSAAKMGISITSNPNLDIKLSSWAKEKLCCLDFGASLGQPEAVRRPRFLKGAREGLVYFLPKGRDGSIIVGLCLGEKDVQRLKMDDQVLHWSRWIG